MKKISDFLKANIEKPWYPIAVSALVLIDNFIFLIPTAIVLLTSVVAHPKQWIRMSFWVWLGNSIGGILFALLLANYGVAFLTAIAPHMTEMHIWQLCAHWIDLHGVWIVFFFCTLPVSEHPAVALAAITGLSIPEIAVAIVVGKFIKFSTIGALAAYTPDFLVKIKVLKPASPKILPPL